MNIKKYLNASLIKTLVFNVHYFGIKAALKPYVLVSRNVKFQKMKGTVKVNNPKFAAIKLGFGYVGIVDKRYNRTLWENTGEIIFKGPANLGTGTKITCCGLLILGEDMSVNANSSIVCFKSIEIGKLTLISWDCLIMDTDFHKIIDLSDNSVINIDEKIVIGNNVWVGCRSTILKGSSIPSNCVIAAGSTVTKKLGPQNTIYISNIKKREGVKWEY